MNTEDSAASRTTLHVQIDTTLDAVGVENLIRQLATARQTMAPAVPISLGDIDEFNAVCLLDPSTTLVCDPPSLKAEATLKLRHQGLGWIGWQLHMGHCIALRDFFNAYFPATNTPSAMNKTAH